MLVVYRKESACKRDHHKGGDGDTAITVQKIARFSIAARRISRGRTTFSRDLTVSSAAIPFRRIVRSMTLFRRESGLQ